MTGQILIVDDDPAFREELRDLLEQKYRVVEAANGEQALRILKKPHAVDLVVLDVVMPDQRGTRSLDIIKRQWPDLPVIIFTGFGTKEVAVEALRARADDYMEKPGDVAMLLEAIDRLIRTRRGSAPGTAGGDKAAAAREFINRNLGRRVILADAARELCVSPKHLSRVFKSRTGVGFSLYLQRERITEAKRLLRTGGHSVEEIAERLGYRHAESFTRAFTRLAGMPPGRFRKRTTGAAKPRGKRRNVKTAGGRMNAKR